MKKNILLIFLVILFSSTLNFAQNTEQRWVFYGKDAKGKEYYYDSNIRKSDSGTLIVWSKKSFPNSTSYDLELSEYNCQKGETKLLKIAQSSINETTSSEINGKWEIPIPNTMNEVALNAICKNVTPVKNLLETKSLGFTFQTHPLIQKSIDFHKGNGRSTMETGLYRSGMFMPMLRRIFREEGVPENIAWIGQIISEWKLNNTSGLWGMNSQIAAKYGLRKTNYINETNSFEKATQASARYLKFLANRYNNNWELAMAAYVSGEDKVDLAIKKIGVADYWKIHPLLPKETRNYVPNILATILIANNPNGYGFGNVRPAPQLQYDQIRVPALTNLSLIAQSSDTSIEYIRYLNPELLANITPPEPYVVRIPAGKANDVVAILGKLPITNLVRVVKALNGDTVATLAAREKVSAIDVAKFNGLLPTTKLDAGREIRIPNSFSDRESISQSSDNNANSKSNNTSDIEDLGIDVAIVSVERADLQERFDSTNSILQVERGALLALLDRTPKNDFYNVIDIKTNLEGWIYKGFVTIKLTNKPNPSPVFEEKKVDSNIDPTLVITNQTSEILSLRLGGQLYTIPPNSEKRIVISAGQYKFYASIPDAIPSIGEKYFPKGIIYYWRFYVSVERR